MTYTQHWWDQGGAAGARPPTGGGKKSTRRKSWEKTKRHKNERRNGNFYNIMNTCPTGSNNITEIPIHTLLEDLKEIKTSIQQLNDKLDTNLPLGLTNTEVFKTR